MFAGVSLEGSVVVTRGDANEKFYGQRVTAKELLTGAIPPPSEADALYRALNAKFHTLGTNTYARNSAEEGGSPLGRSGSSFKSTHISAPGTLRQPPPIRQTGGYGAPMTAAQQHYNSTQSPPAYHATNQFNQTSSYGQDVKATINNQYSNQSSPPQQAYTNNSYTNRHNLNNTSNHNSNIGSFASQAAAKRAPPPPPPSRKPAEPLAKALYAFEGQQQGDLSFQEGDIITVTEKTDSQDDWWTGKVNGRQGIVSERRKYIGVILTQFYFHFHYKLSSLPTMCNYNNNKTRTSSLGIYTCNVTLRF